MIGVFLLLGWIAIAQSGRADSEKKRGDLLQQSVNALRDRADVAQKISQENQNFFETVRRYITAQNEADRKALLDELRGFRFTEPPTTTTTAPRRGTTTTTTTPKTSTTTAPKPPPSTTTTTAPPSPPSQPPPTFVCVNVPAHGRVCQ